MASKQTLTRHVLPAVPAGESTLFVQSVMELLRVVLEDNAQLRQENAQLRESVALLRDEVAVLKGHKPRPKFQGSDLENRTNKAPEQHGTGRFGRSRPKRTFTAQLPIHEDRVIPALGVPPGAVFKGYRDFVVRELVMQAHNIRVRRELWLLADGTYQVAPRPPEFDGLHFGPTLRA